MKLKNIPNDYDISDENRCKFCGETAVKIDDDGEIICIDKHLFAGDNYTSINYPNDEIEDMIESIMSTESISIANILDSIKADYQTIVIHNNDDDDLTFDTYIYLVENPDKSARLIRSEYKSKIDLKNELKMVKSLKNEEIASLHRQIIDLKKENQNLITKNSLINLDYAILKVELEKMKSAIEILSYDPPIKTVKNS